MKNIDRCHRYGFTILHEPVNMEVYNVVKALLDEGVDPRALAEDSSIPID